MNKPLFMKVIEVSNKAVLLPLPEQKVKTSKGEIVDVDTNQMCIPRFPVNMSIGEVYATDKLTANSRGWYNIGTDLMRVCDSKGTIEKADGSNKVLASYLEAYEKYTKGVLYEDEVPKELTLMDKLKKAKNLKPPTIADDGWYVDEELWYHLLRNYSKKKNTLLIGDSGAGKTELVTIMMEKLGKPLEIFDMAISNPTKALCGNLRAENGTTYYQYARFSKAIQNEGTVLLDELSRANPMANNILLPVLDKRRTLYIEDAIDETQIKLSDHCCVMATANIGSKFIGTSMLDHALLNRFYQVEVTYPPKAKESLLLQKVHNLSKYQADLLVDIAQTIRKHQDLSKDISTRQLMEIGELINDGYEIIKAFEYSILMQFESEKGHGGERQIVLSIINSK